jgi:2-polyprenyl-3-methyl-5-hydroxy-6-metoxy-1,4-benzoquinol methylase
MTRYFFVSKDMNYRDQEKFLRGSRIWGAALSLFFLATASAMLREMGRLTAGSITVSLTMAVAMGVSLYYTPDYLHLSVSPGRKARWAIKVRWRIAAAALILGLLLASSNRDRMLLLAAVAWMILTILFAKKIVRADRVPGFFWTSDWVLLLFCMLGQSLALLLLIPAAAAHLLLVSLERRRLLWAILAFGSGLLLLFVDLDFLPVDILLTVSIGATHWLVSRARKQNAKNIGAALRELIEFTGYPADRIRDLWASSNQELARSWELADIPQHDKERMAEWYRKNSELYLFAISAYNLEYKRIRSNMKVLRWARGATLDYGAGNGEILLEVARRGQPAAYYDVEGMTMRFAQHRAERLRLKIDFFRTKDALADAARQRGFDTVFSFDVLEHLPDLAGELSFLSSLLAPGGLFVFDVPAGSTRAHPMHLNHDLEVLPYMRGKGLKDERGWLLRLPFRKEEKFVFRAAT